MNLVEGTDNLYHYAPIGAALKILKSKQFELASMEGNASEHQWAPKGYPFYLSTTRSKIGDYHNRPGSSAVIFNLDGRWLNQRYPVKPIDYWEGMWIDNPDGRTSEAEDRVFSKEPEMPLTPVQSVHLLYKEDGNKDWNHFARNIMLEAKKAGIPIFLYGDTQSWLTQDKRKVISVKDAGDRLKGPSGTGETRRRKSPYLLAWIELYHKRNLEDLGDKAFKQARTLMGNVYSDNEDFGLGNDLRNAAKPNAIGRDASLKILKLMKQHKQTKPVEFVDALRKKWTPIFKERSDKESAEYQRIQKLKKQDDEDYKTGMAAMQESVLTEARGGSVILVDFQPAYATFDPSQYDPAIQNAMAYINKKQPQVTAFFNGEEVGIEDTPDEVMWHFIEHGLDEDNAHLFKFKEKSYAWLRPWMDNDVPVKAIIKAIRYLVMNDMNDSRDMFPEEEDWDYAMEQYFGEDFRDEMLGDNIYIPEINIGTLKSLSGSLLGGGGQHECLKEMQLLMNAFNIKYKMVGDWIYG